MKDPENSEPYTLNLNPQQAALTRPGTFFQLINKGSSLCRVLYIVSPAYLFELTDDGQVGYDDAVVLEEEWAQLEEMGWDPPGLREAGVTSEAREAAIARLTAPR